MNKIMRILFPIIAIAFGIFAIVSGVQKMQTKDQYDASTTAVIEGIEREWKGVDEDGFDEYDYKVYVTYEVDGQKYENREYPGYNSSMQKGDEIEIVYDSSNPEHFAEKNITGNSIIFIAVGAVLTLGGVAAIIKAVVRP